MAEKRSRGKLWQKKDGVTDVTFVTDFDEGSLHEASTGKTLVKISNKSNKNNDSSRTDDKGRMAS